MQATPSPYHWDDIDQVCRDRMEAANLEVKKINDHARETFYGWLRIGAGLDEMQRAAMQLAHANRPTGKAYNAAFRVIAARLPNLASIEMTTRSRAVWMHEKRDILEKWHASLPDHIKQQVNHPATVKRHFENAHKPPSEKPTNSKLKLLEQENEALKRKLALAQSDAGDRVNFRDKPDEIARVLFEGRISSRKIRDITNALAKLERDRRNVRGN